jgi:hypothetical protein
MCAASKPIDNASLLVSSLVGAHIAPSALIELAALIECRGGEPITKTSEMRGGCGVFRLLDVRLVVARTAQPERVM